jgi:hypothetical protein
VAQFQDRRRFPSTVFGASDLPYPVRTTGLELATNILVFGAVLAASLFLAWTVTRPGAPVGLKGFMLAGGAVAAAASSAYRLWLLKSPWLIFYPDRVEKRELTGWTVISRSDIEGIRAAGSDRGGAYFEIVPQQAGARGIRLRERLKKDPVIAHWLEGVRDLTAEAIAADKSAILADPRYGATEADRAARLDLAKTVAKVFLFACIALAVGLYIFPKPYIVTLPTSIAPLLIAAGLVWGFNGLVIWWGVDKARPTVGAAIFPLLGLSFSSAFSLHLIGAEPLIISAAVAGLAAGALIYSRLNTARRSGVAIAAAAFAGFAAFGVAAMTNVAFDPSPAHIFPVTVNNRTVSGSRSRSYNLWVGPWADQPGGEISVPSDYYDKVSLGQTVCLFRHRGAIGLNWFDVADCPAGLVPQEAQHAGPPPLAPPADPANPYPPEAARLGKEGQVGVRCLVGGDQTFTNCAVVSETPPGLGFGDAAVRKLNGMKFSGSRGPLKPGSQISTTVKFKLRA